MATLTTKKNHIVINFRYIGCKKNLYYIYNGRKEGKDTENRFIIIYKNVVESYMLLIRDEMRICPS